MRRHVRPSAAVRVLIVALVACAVVAPFARAEVGPEETAPDPDILDFLRIASPDEAEARAAMERIAPLWRDAHAAMVIDVARFFRPPREARGSRVPGASGRPGDEVGSFGADRTAAAAARDPGSPIRRRLVAFLEERTGQRLGDDLDEWRRWLWRRPYEPHPDYAAFKGGVLSNVDPRYRDLIPPGVASTIRLDQVDWGGVGVDGIPPLVDPTVEPAREARWLKDRHVVFGVVVDGKARAYPKRIVAWHEMVRDRLGGRAITLAYCTLCGAAIPYDAGSESVSRTLGTSGLLYRSNKLMYDAETGSLWSAMTGRPVIGPLAGTDVRLPKLPVVTTTWGEWRALHPETTVLSIETGFERDYREGAAYREYFRSERLMFAVPGEDERLRPKDEVLVLDTVIGEDGTILVVDVGALGRGRAMRIGHGGRTVVLLTDRAGGTRAYEDPGVALDPAGGGERWTDAHGREWTAAADALRSADPEAQVHPRIPMHRSFWFGVVSQYPAVRLAR